MSRLGRDAEKRGGSNPSTRTNCRDDETGNHSGLKIRRAEMLLGVRIPLSVQKN